MTFPTRNLARSESLIISLYRAGPKQRSSSEHRVVKSVDKTSVKSVPKSTDSLLKKLFDKRVEKMIEFSEVRDQVKSLEAAAHLQHYHARRRERLSTLNNCVSR